MKKQRNELLNIDVIYLAKRTINRIGEHLWN